MDKIFRERYLIGLKGSREQTLASCFDTDFFFLQKYNIFLGELNRDDHTLCTSEEVILLRHFQGQDCTPGGRRQTEGPPAADQPAWDVFAYPGFRPCAGSMGILTGLQSVLLYTDPSGDLFCLLKMY